MSGETLTIGSLIFKKGTPESSWKENIQKFVCSIHHLNDPDEINYTAES
jgi:hypothetical protein